MDEICDEERTVKEAEESGIASGYHGVQRYVRKAGIVSCYKL